MNKEWKPIPNFEGWYEVSNFGEVRSVDREVNYKSSGKSFRRGMVLRPKIGKHGYKEVILVINSKRHCYRVHKLVAMAFLPNPNNYSCINHIDENKLNNKVDNLEWCTQKYNTEVYYSNKTVLYQYDLFGNLIRIWNSITKASKYYNIDKTGIHHCCKGSLKTYHNFIWTYNVLEVSEYKRRVTNDKISKIILSNVDNVVIKEFKSMCDAAKYARCSQSFISMCCNGTRKSKLGIWRKLKV